MYDPRVGRWLSQDPLGFVPGDTNLYRYVANDPTSAIDPSGTESTDLAGLKAQQRMLEDQRKNIDKQEKEMAKRAKEESDKLEDLKKRKVASDRIAEQKARLDYIIGRMDQLINELKANLVRQAWNRALIAAIESGQPVFIVPPLPMMPVPPVPNPATIRKASIIPLK
jgi:uncharacterized protein RhaS with RHS repeats